MKTLFEFREFINELYKDNSRNYKISVLEKYRNNDNIKYYLNFVFNPYIVTGISDKKLNKDTSSILGDDVCFDYSEMVKLLEYLKTHNTGTDIDIKTIQMFKEFYIAQYDTDIDNGSLQKLFDNIITKNLQLGVDVKTINKVIPNLIPTFNVQLAEKYFERPEYVEGKEFALTTKIDGGRIVAIKKNGDVKFYTRSGQLYEGLIDLEEEMKLYMPDNIVLDGEITLLNDCKVLYDLKTDEPCIGHKLDSKEQYKETMKITRKDGEKHGVKMLVFDMMTADEFEKQECNTPYFERRSNLIFSLASDRFDEFYKSYKNTIPAGLCDVIDSALTAYLFGSHLRNHMLKKVNESYKYFNILPVLYEGGDASEITKWLNYNVEHGEEGIMINLLNAPYEFTRTWNLLKVKKFNSCDLRVIDLECGTNANSDRLGAFICEYKDGNTVKVGSGFEKELRLEIWNNKKDWLNAIIEVQFFEETENANGGKSLRFPVFKGRRLDKNIPDY